MKGKELDARLVVHHTIFLPHNPSKDRQTGHWRSERNGPGMNWFFFIHGLLSKSGGADAKEKWL